jgi:Ala-tRNA(Pro) deacylase
LGVTCKDRLEQYLRENGVPFEVQHHPRVFTAQEVAAVEHIPGDRLAKVVMAVADDKPVMLALPASYRVDTEKAAAMVGTGQLRLADEREFESQFSDCEVGAMPPFGNLYDVDVYVDEALAREQTIVMRAGTHTDTLSLRYSDFARLVQPRVGEFGRHTA